VNGLKKRVIAFQDKVVISDVQDWRYVLK
jgi:hypothetical protein